MNANKELHTSTQGMFPLPQRQQRRSQNLQFATNSCLQRETTGCATHARAPSLKREKKKHFTGDHQPRKSTKKLKWASKSAPPDGGQDRTTKMLVLPQYWGDQGNYSHNVQNPKRQRTQVLCFVLPSSHIFSLSAGSSRRADQALQTLFVGFQIPCSVVAVEMGMLSSVTASRFWSWLCIKSHCLKNHFH